MHNNQCKPPILLEHDLEKFTSNMICTTTTAITWITRIIIISLLELKNTIITDCQPERFSCGFRYHEPIKLRTHINIQNISHTLTTKDITISKQYWAQTRIPNNTNNWISSSIPDVITWSKHHANLYKWELTIYRQYTKNLLICISSSAIHRLNQLIQSNCNTEIHKRICWHQWQHIILANFSIVSNNTLFQQHELHHNNRNNLDYKNHHHLFIRAQEHHHSWMSTWKIHLWISKSWTNRTDDTHQCPEHIPYIDN